MYRDLIGSRGPIVTISNIVIFHYLADSQVPTNHPDRDNERSERSLVTFILDDWSVVSPLTTGASLAL